MGRPFHLKILFPILSPTSRQVLSNGSIFSPLVGQILSNLNSYWLKLMRNMVSCHDSLLEFHRIFTTNQLGQSHIQLTISQRVHWKTFRAIVLYVDFILSKKIGVDMLNDSKGAVALTKISLETSLQQWNEWKLECVAIDQNILMKDFFHNYQLLITKFET